MPKLLIISVLVGIIAIPVAAAAERNPVRGLKKALFYVLVFNVGYYLALRYVLPRLY